MEKQIAQEEVKAIEAALPAVGAVVAEIEAGRPLSAWSKDEILRLIFTAVRSFQQNMDEMGRRGEPPF